MTVAKFTFVGGTDTTFKVPDDSGINDKHIANTDLPDLASAGVAVLMFKVMPIGVMTLRMRFNSGSERVIDFSAAGSEESNWPRSWHEVFPVTDVRESNNELTISVPEGRAAISDIVIIYPASG